MHPQKKQRLSDDNVVLLVENSREERRTVRSNKEIDYAVVLVDGIFFETEFAEEPILDVEAVA